MAWKTTALNKPVSRVKVAKNTNSIRQGQEAEETGRHVGYPRTRKNRFL